MKLIQSRKFKENMKVHGGEFLYSINEKSRDKFEIITITHQRPVGYTSLVEDNKNDDFTLDLSSFNDEVVDVNKSDNTEEDIIKQNELDELSKFMS